jgi:hypothetical protein
MFQLVHLSLPEIALGTQFLLSVVLLTFVTLVDKG